MGIVYLNRETLKSMAKKSEELVRKNAEWRYKPYHVDRVPQWLKVTIGVIFIAGISITLTLLCVWAFN